MCLLNNLMRAKMKIRRVEPVTQLLLKNTILNDGFQPMQQALSQVRFSDAIFNLETAVGGGKDA